MSEKLELKDILGALDLGAKEVWDEFTDDQKKSVSFYLLNRYMSSVKASNKEMQEHFILAVNEYYNKNFFLLSKHPKLLWQLLCLCSHESKKIMYHEWIGHKKKAGNSKLLKVLLDIYPNKKQDEVELLSTMLSEKEIKVILRDHGFEEADIAKKLK
jgi:hypothetical protein